MCTNYNMIFHLIKSKKKKKKKSIPLNSFPSGLYSAHNCNNCINNRFSTTDTSLVEKTSAREHGTDSNLL